MAEVKPDLAIYKILLPEEWEMLREDGTFHGAPVDLADGFIHFSRANQVRATVAAHFGDVDEIVLVEVATDGLIEGLRWEASRGGALFPHLYGTFGCDDVRRTWNLSRRQNDFDWPESIPAD